MTSPRRVLSVQFTSHTRAGPLGMVEVATSGPELSLFTEGSLLLLAYRKDGQPVLEGLHLSAGSVRRLTYEPDASLLPAELVKGGAHAPAPVEAPALPVEVAEQLDTSAPVEGVAAPGGDAVPFGDEAAPEAPQDPRELVTVEKFAAFLAEEKARCEARGFTVDHSMRESVAIGLRHFIHPHGYGLAFDFMRMAAETVGDTLTPDGVWEHGAKGELWLPQVLATRGTFMGPPTPPAPEAKAAPAQPAPKRAPAAKKATRKKKGD